MPLPETERIWTRVEAGGRIVLPAKFRKQAGIKPGDGVQSAWDEQGILTVLTVDAVTRLVQAMVRQHVPEGVSRVDELVAERREEVERELREEAARE